VSVIITSRNRPEHLIKCLTSILEKSKLSNEIIVGDDSDDTWGIHAAIPKEIRRRILYLPAAEQQLGFAHNANRCIPRAKGFYVTLPFSEDVEVLEGWDTEAVKAFGDGIGQVAFNVGLEQYGEVTSQLNGISADYVAKGMTLKAMYELVGLYDTQFYPLYGEDVDLSWRILEAGFGIADCPTACVLHHHTAKWNEG
jgi:GT2 family glycosyltransferase